MSPRTASQDARIDRTATALGSRLRAETTGVLSAVGKLRIPEFVLFFGLIFEGSMFGLPIPFNQVVVYHVAEGMPKGWSDNYYPGMVIKTCDSYILQANISW